MTDLTPMMKRIMALLAKAESTTHEAEAQAFYAKATELMVKHAIDEADLKPDERATVAVVHGIEVGKGRPNHMLIGAAGSSVGVKAISNFTLGTVSLVGFPVEIDFTQRLYASLLLQRERFLLGEPRTPWDSARSFNHSFRVHFANRVAQRLMMAKNDVVRSAGASKELVLVSRSREVDTTLAREFPQVRDITVSTSSRSGAIAGSAAASRADVSGGRRTVSGEARGAVS